MKILLLFSVLFYSIILSTCGTHSGSEPANETASVEGVAPATPKQEEPPSATMEQAVRTDIDQGSQQPVGFRPVDKKIIKDGSISIKVNYIKKHKQAIDQLLKAANAYYEREDLTRDPIRIAYALKVRVPTQYFESLVASIEHSGGEITNKSILARDVTEEFVDIEARLASKRAYLKRYQELLAKATNVKDIVAIEENIRTIQEEIESREGRLKYLSDQVAFSTLQIDLYEEIPYVYRPQPEDRFTERLKRAFASGWSSIVSFLIWMISLWPFVLIIVLIIALRRRVLRSRRRKNA